MASKIVWFEVVGQDADKLRSFYGDLFGWSFDVMGQGDYGLTKSDETGLPGGIGKAQAGPGWNTFYVGVDDLEGTLAAVEASGGTLLQPPTEMPDGGRIAVFADPEGRPVGIATNQPG